MENQVKNSNLNKAQKEKNDEFYTQYHDIEKEMNAYLEYDANTFRGKTVLLPCDDPVWSNFTKYFAQNFTRLGLKKLISTGYAIDGDQGKIFTIDSDINGDGIIDIDDLKWEYLEGDGDFRSDDIKRLRSEADIIVTNPPFSLFREFIDWIFEANKKCLIIGNMNAITYKNVFPLIKENKLWLGATISSGDREFRVPHNYPLNAAGFRVSETGEKYIRVKGVRWFANLEHGRRHQPLQLMTMADNNKFNKKVIKNNEVYKPYSNYNAIEVSFTDAIPSDYDGVMGVPISFLDKYCPEQFEIVGLTASWDESDEVNNLRLDKVNRNRGIIVGDTKEKYARILIKHKNI